MKRSLIATLLGALAISAAGCVFVFHHVDVQPVVPRDAVATLLRGPSVATPTRPQLENLSAVWTGLWQEIDSSVRPKTRASVQRVPFR
jgi:hypothetical protein